VKPCPPETLPLFQFAQAADLRKVLPKAIQFFKPEFGFAVTRPCTSPNQFHPGDIGDEFNPGK
jgi:hypothetical protein